MTLHALTNFEQVLEAALAKGMVTNSEALIVRDWLGDPRGWETRR